MLLGRNVWQHTNAVETRHQIFEMMVRFEIVPVRCRLQSLTHAAQPLLGRTAHWTWIGCLVVHRAPMQAMRPEGPPRRAHPPVRRSGMPLPWLAVRLELPSRQP